MTNIIKIIFKISATSLADGNYQPKITLVEADFESKKFVGFIIHEKFSTKEEALKRAKAHAIDEAHKQYGKNVAISIETEN